MQMTKQLQRSCLVLAMSLFACGTQAATITAITAGTAQVCALTDAGAVKCWGQNALGQLGDGTSDNIRSTPVDVVGLGSGVTAIAAGQTHTCALTSVGGVKCWGWNGDGQLGDNSVTQRLTPVDVVGLSSGVTAISAGFNHSCALTSAGALKCWGWNDRGQLGDNSTTNRLTPVDVVGLSSGVTAVAAARNHTCALTSAGAVKCWGDNAYFQLGDNSATQRLTPVDVVGLSSGVTAISASFNHSCALTSVGAVKCWGNNSNGQLGDNTTTNRQTPVAVVSLGSGVTALATGYYHSCALNNAGAVQCWGSNGNGALGDNSTIDRRTPVAVVGLNSGLTAIATGNHHSCALTSANQVKCWGYNLKGQLGDNSTTQSLVPVDVRFDEDGDGMPDAWESQYGLNPLVNDAAGDLDTDGLTNLQEFIIGTTPDNADSDGDTVNDSGDNCPVASNVSQLNTDGDAQGDACDEDNDNDGMPDIWEITYGLNAFDASDANGDLDGDGISNVTEYLGSSDPTLPNKPSSNFDADADSDIFWRRADTGQCHVWLMQNGVRSVWNDLGYTATRWSYAGMGDFNADGDKDILLRDTATGENFVLALENGLKQSGASIGYNSAALTVQAVGDLDGDGDDDILLRNNTTSEFKGNFMQNHASAGTSTLGYNKTSLAFKGLADVDGDGDKDIVQRNDSTAEIKVQILQGGVNTGPVSFGYNTVAHSFKAVLDADGDGDDDFLLRKDSDGSMIIVENEGGNKLKVNSLGYNSTALSFMSTGDFDGDGDQDIILRNATTGELVTVMLQNATRAGGGSIGFVNTRFSFVGTGDFDGDGDDDLLFRDAATGENVRISMQNGANLLQSQLDINNVNLVPYLK